LHLGSGGVLECEVPERESRKRRISRRRKERASNYEVGEVLVLLFDSVSRAWYSICAQRCEGQPFSLSHLATCLVVFVVVIVVITIVSLSPSRFSALCACFSLSILSAFIFLCLGFDGFSVSSWWKQLLNSVLCFFCVGMWRAAAFERSSYAWSFCVRYTC